MNEIQKQIKIKVDKFLNLHVGGEAFFDELDGELLKETNMDIICALLKFVPKENPYLVLSGSFGKKIANDIQLNKLPKFPYTLYAGGIRKTKSLNLLHQDLYSMKNNFIFLDDSYYSGTTFYTIKQQFNDIFCAVIYDGSRVHNPLIRSLFRYYNFYK